MAEAEPQQVIHCGTVNLGHITIAAIVLCQVVPLTQILSERDHVCHTTINALDQNILPRKKLRMELWSSL